MNNSGDRLREERERLGFSQTALGAIGGVLKQAQLKYEKGERFPDAAYLDAASKVGIDIQYVVTGTRSTAALSDDEAELLAGYRAAPLAVKAAVIGALSAGSTSQASQTFQGSMQVFHEARKSKIAGRDIVKGKVGKGKA